MKRIIFLALCITLLHTGVKAQSFNWGIRVGLSTPDIRPADVNPLKTDSLLIKVNDAAYGFHFGLWTRLAVSKFFIQPEVLINSSKVTYGVADVRTGRALVDSLRNERFVNLDIPVLLGMKLGAFRVNAGPIGHIHMAGTSDLAQFSSFKSSFKTMTLGYQAGLGADFGKLGIDIRYEGNFAKFGSHINFKGTSYEFDKSPNRFVVSMGIGF